VVLAASTHAGEEALIATAIREAGAFPLIVPRHAERRATVVADLQQAGFTPILRTAGELPTDIQPNTCYVADTTGELREWTALADAVVIGKSFLAKGGQNPVEAIAARKPVVIGPDMTNFADLITLLKNDDAILSCTADELGATIAQALDGSEATAARVERAYHALNVHSGATRRSVELVETLYGAA
jgi:3-deoxy-D-manno-octulosonic-acid transferase